MVYPFLGMATPAFRALESAMAVSIFFFRVPLTFARVTVLGSSSWTSENIRSMISWPFLP